MTSWFTQYRPQTFSGLHRQPVREQLLRLLSSQPFPQVLLFAGSRGTGKTTAARILAAMLNDPANAETVETLFFEKSEAKKKARTTLVEPTWSPQTESIIHGKSFVVHEIDAASHRGIDDIRELRERLPIPPQIGKVAVYILDEVHMLTTEAFNALLKILEEPPAHVVFVLATTEPEKIIPTIRSRCLEITFSKPTLVEIAAALTGVAQAEKLSAEPAALQMVAQQADGSFRDAVKLLQQLAQADSTITEELVEKVLAIPSVTFLTELTQAVVAKNDQAVVTTCQQLRERGYDSLQVRKVWLSWLHTSLLQSILTPTEALFSKRVISYLLHYLDQLQLTKYEGIPLLSLEVALLELVYKAQGKPPETGAPPKAGGGAAKVSQPKAKHTATTTSTPEVEAVPVVSLPKIEVAGSADSHQAVLTVLAQWETMVEKIKQTNSSLGAILQSAVPQPEKSNGVVSFGVYFPFHREQLLQEKFRTAFELVTEELTTQKLGFDVVILEREAELAHSLLT